MYICGMIRQGRMQRIDLYVKLDQLKRLKGLSDKTGAPVAELVRRAVEAYLKTAQAKRAAR